MRVVILAETFPRNTGYFGVMFPKYLAREGVDVHLLTLDLPPYWNVPGMREHYERLVGPEWLQAGRVAQHDGYTVHVLPHQRVAGHVRMRGLASRLRQLRPDVVYSLSAIGWLALEAAALKPLLGYKLFTGSHTAASTFPLYWSRKPWHSPERLRVLLLRGVPGRLVSLATEKCYGPTRDCAEIAWRYFGVQRHKTAVMHLGVDTDVYFPVRDEQTRIERETVRRELGYAPDEVIAIYTGKLTAEKNVAVLADAVDALRSAGRSFRTLVIGDGPETTRLAARPTVRLLPLQPYHRLARYYRAADVAVWPTNESTAMLDAAACGLPLVVSDGIVYREHVDGNGLVYRMNDCESLVQTLTLLADPDLRSRLGQAGADKMVRRFSWAGIARARLREYQLALGVPEVNAP